MFTYTINESLSLKLVEMKDAERIFELTNSNRSHLRQWLPWLDWTQNQQDTEAWIKGAMEGYASQRSITTAIIYKESIVGVASFNSLDWSNKIAYIGYWLGQEFQGNGIVTSVAEALTQYAFETLEFNRVDIRAAEFNKKSRAIPERLGFQYEGKIRQAEWLYDHYVDHAVYGMLVEEWKAIKESK